MSLSRSVKLRDGSFLQFYAAAFSFLLSIRLKTFETLTVKKHLPNQSPTLLSGLIQRLCRFAFEQIDIRKEVMRTFAALQTGDQLQENAVQPLGQRAFVGPFVFEGMFLAFEQN